MNKFRNTLLASMLLCTSLCSAQQLPMRLWYNTPATLFEESLPIGNGKLGALVYGNPEADILHLNDITFWTGKPVDLTIDADAHKALPSIREALFSEDYPKAEQLQHKLQGANCQDYMPLGTLTITDLNSGNTAGYYRQLSLDSAMVCDQYTRNGVTFSREYIVSHPAKAIAVRLKASKAGCINVALKLSSLVSHSVKATGNELAMTGHAKGDERETIHFLTILKASTKGGSTTTSGSSLIIKDATEATVYIVNETSFNGYDKHPVKEGAPYEQMAKTDMENAAKLSFDDMLAAHVSDYQGIYNRLTLSLAGAQLNATKTTEDMIKQYGKGNAAYDKYLEALYFQYGRYMLISSSRTPCVPANLQGLWNEKLRAPWHGNYTININLEENYWPCDVANMSEMFDPLSSYTHNLSVTGHSNAQNYYGINSGWSCGHNSDIWAMTNPVGEKRESTSWSNWNMGGAWLMQNIYDHYLYTQDKDYLANVAYPQMKGAADFMLRWLIENPKKPGELITAPSTSPEAYYINDKGFKGASLYGGTADLAIIRELFNNTIEAARTLGKDKKFQDTLRRTVAKLHPYVVGHEGDLNEWYYDWDDQDRKHRHQSHLIGLYPGHHITVDGTPDLAAAATKTLEQKGDATTGWSTGWRVNLWARLHNGQQAYHLYQKLLRYVDPRNAHGGGAFPNLFDAHPPFQIDGNFGGTAGLCEMLMQSGNGIIELLPALPEQWPEGEIKGLKARGGFEVSLAWKDGKVTAVNVTGKPGSKVTMVYNGKRQTVKLNKGKWQL